MHGESQMAALKYGDFRSQLLQMVTEIQEFSLRENTEISQYEEELAVLDGWLLQERVFYTEVVHYSQHTVNTALLVRLFLYIWLCTCPASTCPDGLSLEKTPAIQYYLYISF